MSKRQFLIKVAFNLKSAGDKLMHIGSRYATDDEDQIAELQSFEERGSCEEVKSQPKKQETKQSSPGTQPPPADPNDDITVVPGIGKGSQKKLAELEKPVTTLSELKDALNREDVKEVLSVNFEKVEAYFQDNSSDAE